jgi:hypothetical protein
MKHSILGLMFALSALPSAFAEQDGSFQASSSGGAVRTRHAAGGVQSGSYTASSGGATQDRHAQPELAV